MGLAEIAAAYGVAAAAWSLALAARLSYERWAWDRAWFEKHNAEVDYLKEELKHQEARAELYRQRSARQADRIAQLRGAWAVHKRLELPDEDMLP